MRVGTGRQQSRSPEFNNLKLAEPRRADLKDASGLFKNIRLYYTHATFFLRLKDTLRHASKRGEQCVNLSQMISI